MDEKPGTGEGFTVRISQLATANILTASGKTGKRGTEEANPLKPAATKLFMNKVNFSHPPKTLASDSPFDSAQREAKDGYPHVICLLKGHCHGSFVAW